MKSLAILTLLVGFAAFAQSPLKFKVEGMDCPFCASKIEQELKTIESVKDFDIDMDEQLLTVEPSAKDFPKTRIIEAVSAAGFSAKALD